MKKIFYIALLLTISHMHAMESGEAEEPAPQAQNPELQFHKELEGKVVIVKNAEGERVAFYTKRGTLMVLSRTHNRWFQTYCRS
jgi:hypothetical protein